MVYGLMENHVRGKREVRFLQMNQRRISTW